MLHSSLKAFLLNLLRCACYWQVLVVEQNSCNSAPIGPRWCQVIRYAGLSGRTVPSQDPTNTSQMTQKLGAIVEPQPREHEFASFLPAAVTVIRVCTTALPKDSSKVCSVVLDASSIHISSLSTLRRARRHLFPSYTMGKMHAHSTHTIPLVHHTIQSTIQEILKLFLLNQGTFAVKLKPCRTNFKCQCYSKG